MTDEAKALVERLRNEAAMVAEDVFQSDPETLDDAADLIETQAREIKRLREALEPLRNSAEAVADSLNTAVMDDAIDKADKALREYKEAREIERLLTENAHLREALKEARAALGEDDVAD